MSTLNYVAMAVLLYGAVVLLVFQWLDGKISAGTDA